MFPGYTYGYPQQGQQPASHNDVDLAALLPLLQDKHTQAKLDALGALFNDLKAQWNLVNPGHVITAKDYSPTL